MSGRWVDLREAAELLGTSTEAVRKRASRGSLRSDRQDGRVLVWVDDGRTEGGREAQVEGFEALVEELRDRVRSLERRMDEEREARRRADTIIAQLTQANAALAAKVPELEAPREPPGASEGVVEELETVEPRSDTPGPQEARERTLRGEPELPWWRRLFGG